MLKNNLIQTITIFIAGILFFGCAFFGYTTGKAVAESGIVFQNASQVTQGLEYFKADQDRYPTEFEYANHDLMGVYFNVFPPASIATSNCPSNFSYKTSDPKTYVLNFCLPHSHGIYSGGWNQVSPKPSLE
jgi:hypothetical protein